MNMKTFVNFSNHPSSAWDKKQIKASLSYGTIVDLPFPQVDPRLDEDEIAAMADIYVKKIEKLSPAAVMCQGEFSLTFAVVTKLKEMGITAVSACSQRNVITKDSIKISSFTFVRYRKY